MICGVHSGQVGLDQVRYNRVYSLEVTAEHNLFWCSEVVTDQSSCYRNLICH